MYTALRVDQSNNQRALYDVNQFTDTLTSLLHLPKVIEYEQERTNAHKSLCEETLEDGCDSARYLCGHVDAALGCDDLGLNDAHPLFRFRLFID